MPNDPESMELFRQYQAGDDIAANQIFDRYLNRLVALARVRIGPKLRRRVDAEDVVQSAYRSFFVHAKEEYQIQRAGDLWRLLAGITLNKLHRQIERQTAAKRSINNEEACEFDASRLINREPSVAEVIGVAEELNLVLNDLSQPQRIALLSRLQGKEIAEIAVEVELSERSVRRILADARKAIELRLKDPNPAPSPLPVLDPSLVRLQFHDYTLQKLLGSGGMGKVYRAKEKRTGRMVAMKTIHKSRQRDQRTMERFTQEAKILAQTSHPHIVGVQGVGQFPSGGLFIVMDFVDGVTLETMIVRDRLAESDVHRIAEQILSAVDHLHRKGIVHGDLKPANILVDLRGTAYVADFGFSHFIESEQGSEIVGGTFGFLAPEVLEFKTGLTIASDIYAVGAILQPLADSMSMDGFGKIAAKCMADDPEQRYNSVAELRNNLRMPD